MATIIPFVDEGLGNSSYLVELGDGRALVVDPTRDVRPYVRWAAEHRVDLAFSVESHLHSDFVSGSAELAGLGAATLVPRGGRQTFPHRGMSDSDEIDLGGLVLRAVGTPGHTPEHLAFLLLEGSRPIALFSGGALLAGSVARTDLIGADQTEPLARQLYRALRERILSLPDDLPVYPTHGAGSFCSAPGGDQRTTTIGRERVMNALLGAPDEDSFVHLLTAGLGTYPDYFRRLREVNRRGPRVYGARQPVLRLLEPDAVEDAVRSGAELVDVRPIERYAAGHIRGALSIALRDAFASWLGWIVPPDRPLVFVLDDDQDRGELVRQCLKVGYEILAGELAGGMAAWRGSGRPESQIGTERDPAALRGTLLDVRQASEYAAGHIPGSLHLELGSLPARVDGFASEAVIVLCEQAMRATSAASLIERAGGRATVFLGNPATWSSATGRPLATGA